MVSSAASSSVADSSAKSSDPEESSAKDGSGGLAGEGSRGSEQEGSGGPSPRGSSRGSPLPPCCEGYVPPRAIILQRRILPARRRIIPARRRILPARRRILPARRRIFPATGVKLVVAKLKFRVGRKWRRRRKLRRAQASYDGSMCAAVSGTIAKSGNRSSGSRTAPAAHPHGSRRCPLLHTAGDFAVGFAVGLRWTAPLRVAKSDHGEALPCGASGGMGIIFPRSKAERPL